MTLVVVLIKIRRILRVRLSLRVRLGPNHDDTDTSNEKSKSKSKSAHHNDKTIYRSKNKSTIKKRRVFPLDVSLRNMVMKRYLQFQHWHAGVGCVLSLGV